MPDRRLDDLVRQLAELFQWPDGSYLYATVHLRPTVQKLQADLAAVTEERDSLIRYLNTAATVLESFSSFRTEDVDVAD